jgi:hypothetical protein
MALLQNLNNVFGNNQAQNAATEIRPQSPQSQLQKGYRKQDKTVQIPSLLNYKDSNRNIKNGA